MSYVYNVERICDAPVNGSMETGGGLRLCCNPAHNGDPRGPVWHRIAEWDAPLKGFSVFGYFRQKFGIDPRDESLIELALDSPCGQDCRRVIDAAHQFFIAADPAVHPKIREAANMAVEIFWRG
jgi:hypothetical protein